MTSSYSTTDLRPRLSWRPSSSFSSRCLCAWASRSRQACRRWPVIITGIVGGIVVGFLAGSPLQVSGPAAGLTVLVWQLVQEQGLEMLGVIVLFAGLDPVCRGHFQARTMVPRRFASGHPRDARWHWCPHLRLDVPRDAGLPSRSAPAFENLLGIPNAIISAISAGDSHLIAGGIGLLTIVAIDVMELS